MKLPLLLTEFLYKNKRLSLPGIGIFTLDPAAVIPDEHNKDIHAIAVGIEFKNAAVYEPDDELIEYIRANTGKIRPLAMADLSSYLTLGTEMLNIGKPFYLEGIGMLTKTQGKGFEFVPGEYAVVKQEGANDEKFDKQSRRKSILEEAQYELQPNRARKMLVLVAVILGLSVIGWGGYMMYKKNSGSSTRNIVNAVAADTAAIKRDSVQTIPATDSLLKNKTDTNSSIAPLKDSPLYKFIILETYDKERALKRYNQLLGYNLKIRMYTKDSSFFKVYFSFHALPRDTVYIKDSLASQYGHRVIIERQKATQ